jgi:hypothetical protein
MFKTLAAILKVVFANPCVTVFPGAAATAPYMKFLD